ncbi:MAG: TIGR03663 family protein, partial [Dehalococcoidia bacterium]|nr:TIGR03663 family protein [Dehalococcoidia bacterium]
MSSRQIENEEEQVREDPPSLIDRIFGPGPVSLRWEIAAYLLLIAVAAGLRFWDLGFRAIHHDESLHATYSWYLAVGKGYRHDPMMHGPLLFLLTGLEYYLLGASDYMARVMPALLGTVAVGLPWLLRGRLGRAGALATSGLLTISPGFLYYSRFLREDIFMVVWTLLTVIFMWRYLDDRRPRNLYFLAAALALSFAQKETAFINVAIFGSFLFFMFLTSDARRSKPSDDTPGPDAVAGRLLILIGTLVLPLFIGGVKLVERFSPIRLPGPTDPNAVALFGGILLVVLAVCAVVGHWWNGPLWNRLAILFWAIYVVLYTTFLSNMAGLGTGIVGSLTYWLDQHGVRRGDQPVYYYLLLLSIYEFLPIALGTIATVYYLIRRDLFTSLLIYWAGAALVLYSVAGEKMPWLSLHIALPLIL